MAKLESKQTDLWVVLFVTFAAATIITILRLLSRRLKRIPLSWDDYFALCGYVSFYSATCKLANANFLGHLCWLDHYYSLL
jgi:hypothetical protein